MTIETKYGSIAIVIENDKKKCNFNDSNFNCIMSLIAFLNDKELCKQIFNY